MNTTHNHRMIGALGRFFKGVFLTLMVSLVALSACSDDEIDRQRPLPPPNPNNPNADVLFEINMPQTMVPSTYALTPTEENNIKSVEILLFKIEGVTKTYTGKPYYCDKIEDVAGGLIAAKKQFSINLPKGGPYDIVILANSRQAVEDILVTGAPTATQKDDVLALLTLGKTGKWISDAGHADYKPIPMWGEMPDKTVAENLKFSVSLLRMLAKVDVAISTDAQPSFVLHAVHLVKANTSGHIIPAPANLNGGLAEKPTLLDTPSVTATHTYLASDYTGGDKALKDIIYTFEATKAVAGSLIDATCVVLQGSFQGGDTENYYRLDFGDKTNTPTPYLDLLRNFKYNIVVQKISGTGQGTLGDAIKNPSTNIIADLTVWDNSEFPIIVFDNTYSMGLSSDDITLPYRASNQNRLKVMTDYTGGWKIDKILDPDGTTTTSWLTTDITTGVATTPADIKFNVAENGATPRICYIYISAGPLKYKIKVTQSQSTLMRIGKIAWKDYDDINSTTSFDGGFTSISITDDQGNIHTPPIATIGNISPELLFEAITSITVVYRDYTLVIPADKYTYDTPTKTLNITDRTLIGKPVHLHKIRLNYVGDYIQVANIDIADDANLYGNWEPIGYPTGRFAGSYDGGSGNLGKGFNISNLNIDRPNSYAGLFGFAAGASFKNIHITSGTIEGDGYVGAICGYISDGGTIIGCSNAATIKSKGSYIGGICGWNHSLGIQNCRNTGNITVTDSYGHIGGICGTSNYSSIIGCTNSGVISGTGQYLNYVGGICGESYGAVSIITNCQNLLGADVSGTLDNVGGITGSHTGTGEMKNCTNAANITGENYVGGLIGNSSAIIDSSNSNSGSVTGTTYVGGICGYNSGLISGVTNTGSVTTTNMIAGGICGYNTKEVVGCSNKASISASGESISWIGGICGRNIASASIKECHNLAEGVVSGMGSQVGGIAGDNAGTLTGSTNSAAISGIGDGIGGNPISTYVGGIAGNNIGVDAIITNSNNLLGGDVSGRGGYIGGISGGNGSNGDRTGVIISCKNSGTVSGIGTGSYIGGITGANYDNISSSTNEATGIITGENNVGGICGHNEDAEVAGPILAIQNCANLAPVTGNGSKIGGICGENIKGTISYSTNDGAINSTGSAASYVGGICGRNGKLSGVIKNSTNFVNGTVTGASIIGGICGYNDVFGSISSSVNHAAIKGTMNDIGGICGFNRGVRVLGSTNKGSVKGEDYVGGVCGRQGLGGNIDGGSNSAIITGVNHVGGICGSSNGLTSMVQNSHNLTGGDVKGSGGSIGGVVGTNAGSIIRHCSNNAPVTTTGIFHYVGGIAGRNHTSAQMSSCHNLAGGTVQSAGSNVGGVAGDNNGTSIISGCSNAASITAAGNSAGGIAGYDNGGLITSCFNTGAIKATDYSGGITGYIDGPKVSASYNLGGVTATSGTNIGAITGGINTGSLTDCYFGESAKGMTEITGSKQFASGVWPDESMTGWELYNAATAPDEYWISLSAWGGTYPTLVQ